MTQVSGVMEGHVKISVNTVSKKQHVLLFQTSLKIKLLFQGNRAEIQKEKEVYAMKVQGRDTCKFFFLILTH